MRQPICQQCEYYQLSLLKYCNREETEEISLQKAELVYKKGQLVFQEGSKPLGLYHIYKGKVKVFRQAPGGNEVVFRIAINGDFLGHYSFLTNAHYQISAMALEDTAICLIPKELTKGIFNQNEVFREALMKKLSDDIRHYFHKIASLGYKSVRARIAEALLELHKNNENSDELIKMVKISRLDLAGLVGTVKETAIRTLKELKDDGYIDIVQGRIEVIDLDGLHRVSTS